MGGLSAIERLATLPEAEFEAALAGLSCEEMATALYDWSLWARPGEADSGQMEPPGDWTVWLLRSGRGAGKTRVGAEWVRSKAEAGNYGRFALVAPTAADARDTMVEGDSGMLACSPPWFMPRYEPSKRRLTWPNGAVATLYSADEPNRLRGPQHEAAWCDELATWKGEDAWDQLMFGLRLGSHPRVIITSTPRPTKLIKKIAARPDCEQTQASTYSNRAMLAPSFFTSIPERYKGTRLARQEVLGEILEDVPGALWTLEAIDRYALRDGLPEVNGRTLQLGRIVVAVDPAVTSGEDSDETGIVVAAAGPAPDGGREPAHCYVLEDLTCREAPIGWARRVVAAYHLWKADRVVAEVNNGGDLVGTVLRQVNSSVAYHKVHASRGKRVRAEPVSALYEQGRVHHVGVFADLEEQMRTFVPDYTGGSPDRVDALVWAVTELLVKRGGRDVPPPRMIYTM